MSEVDLQSLPPLLTADIQRTQGNGLPTEALQDWEQFQQNWFVDQAVKLDTKLTTVSSQTDTNTASITNEITARTSADAAEATARLALAAQVGDNQAEAETKYLAFADADTALSGRIDTVETTLDGQTATISELTASVNGIAVQKVLTATINNVTGGYEFAGVKNADGTGATFTMTFNSNVVINGSLLVNGSVGGLQIANGSVTDKFDFPMQTRYNQYQVWNGANFSAFGVWLDGDGGAPIQHTFVCDIDTPIEIIVNPSIFYVQANIKVAVFKNGNYEAPLGLYVLNGTGANYVGTSSDTSGLQGSLIYKSIMTPGTWTYDIRMAFQGNVSGQSKASVLEGTRITMIATRK